MEYKTEKVVHVSHYSAVHPVKCEIIEANDNTLTIRLSRQLSMRNFLVGDPAVIMIKEDGKTFNIGCTIINIDTTGLSDIVLSIDSLEPGAEQRRHDRYPVSMYSDVRLSVKDKKHAAVVKDISYFGMRIFCKESFNIGDTLHMDLYMQQKIIFIKTIVLRKVSYPQYNEYGLRIEYDNYDTLNFFKAYIKNLGESK